MSDSKQQQLQDSEDWRRVAVISREKQYARPGSGLRAWRWLYTIQRFDSSGGLAYCERDSHGRVTRINESEADTLPGARAVARHWGCDDVREDWK